MNITRLKIENFLSIKEAECEDLADWGLTLIQGENLDDPSAKSNGAGKSSLVDAISWCLYGETARGVAGDEVINNQAKKGTKVAIEISEPDGTVYRVERGRKHKDIGNGVRLFTHKGGPWEDITLGTNKLTQAQINRVTGCPHEVFVSGVYAGQEAMPNLPGLTDKALKELVEKAAGIDRLQLAFENAKAKALEARKKLARLIADQDVIAGRVKLLESQEAGIAQKIKSWEDQRLIRIADAEGIVATLKTQVAEAKAALKPGTGKIVAEGLAKIADRRLALKGDEVKHKDAQAAVRAQDLKVNTIEAALKAASREEASGKSNYAHVSHRVGTPCGECGKAIEEADVDAVKRGVLLRIKDAMSKKETSQRELDEAKEHAKTLAERAESLSSYLDTASKLNELERKLNNMETEDRRLRLVLEAHEKGLTVAIAAETTTRTEINPFLGMLAGHKKEIDNTRVDLADAAALVSDAAAISERLDRAVEVFGPAGVRAHILDTVTPFLNAQTTNYLGRLSDGNILAEWSTVGFTKSGELREEFNIAVDNLKGSKCFAGLSGGEKRKVRLACAMALQDLVATRATKPIRMFIADEIDDALDEAALERLMGILEDKAKERGTVLVISHNSLRDWIRNVILVKKEKDFSTIEIEA